jgi:hypothetical protein
MLGDQIAEDKGKITSQRVLDIVVDGIPKMEISFSSIVMSNQFVGYL